MSYIFVLSLLFFGNCSGVVADSLLLDLSTTLNLLQEGASKKSSVPSPAPSPSPAASPKASFDDALHSFSKIPVTGFPQGFIKLPVLQQGSYSGQWPSGNIEYQDLDTQMIKVSWKDIAAGDGLNCGYHALKNVMICLNGIERKDASYFEKMQQPKVMTDLLGLWLPVVLPYREWSDNLQYRARPTGNWVSSTELEFVMNPEKNVIPAEYSTIFGGDMRNVIKVTDNFDYFTDPAKITEPQAVMLRDLIKNDDYLQGIVVNTSVGGCHWVSYVVQKVNKVYTVYYMDSLSGVRNDLNQQLVQLLSMSLKQAQANVDQLHQRALDGDFKAINRMITVLDVDDDQLFFFKGALVKNVSLALFKTNNFTKEDLVSTGWFSDQSDIDDALLAQVNDAMHQALSNADSSRLIQNYIFSFWQRADGAVSVYQTSQLSKTLDQFLQENQDSFYLEVAGVLGNYKFEDLLTNIFNFLLRRGLDPSKSDSSKGLKDMLPWNDTIKNQVIDVAQQMIAWLGVDGNDAFITQEIWNDFIALFRNIIPMGSRPNFEENNKEMLAGMKYLNNPSNSRQNMEDAVMAMWQ